MLERLLHGQTLFIAALPNSVSDAEKSMEIRGMARARAKLLKTLLNQ